MVGAMSATQADLRTNAKRLTLVATSLGFGVVQLDVSVVNVAVKSIGAALGGGISSLQLVVSAYTVAFAAFILTAGALGDRIGARRVFLGGFLIFTLASVLCGLAPSLGVLVAARAVQGVGAGVLVPASLSLIIHTYPEPAARARAIGLYLAGASLALAGGPLVGGVLIAGFGWRAIFFINVPVALVGVLLTAGYARETPTAHERRLDLPGQVAAVVTLVALVVAIIEGGSHGFAAPAVLAGFAVAVVAGASFLVLEARAVSPMLPLRLFHSRTFSVSAAMGLLVNTAFYGLIFILSLLFQRELRFSPLQTGLALAPMMVGVTASNLIADRIVAAIGRRRAILGGALAFMVACAGMLGVGRGSSYMSIVIPITLLGVGGGVIIPVITAELLGSVESSRSGVAAGTLNTLRQTGSAVGVALFGSLIAGALVAGTHVALLISIGLLAAISVLAVSALERPAPGG